MRSVKQVSDLTGISVRTLQYYDEIGLFKPSEVTEAGYRMYNDEALGALQQILFFKELDFQLKDIKTIMQNPNYDKIAVFENQKQLIQAKSNKFINLLNLLDKLIKGEKCMSFKEFDMSEYFSAVDEFKITHADEMLKFCGSQEEYDKYIHALETMKDKESEIAKMAIKQYGSIEKYTEAMKKSMSNFVEKNEDYDSMKKSGLEYMEKNDEIVSRLTVDINIDASGGKTQKTVEEFVNFVNESMNGVDMGDNFWNICIEGYETSEVVIEATDKKYGKGSADFIARALKVYFNM